MYGRRYTKATPPKSHKKRKQAKDQNTTGPSFDVVEATHTYSIAESCSNLLGFDGSQIDLRELQCCTVLTLHDE